MYKKTDKLTGWYLAIGMITLFIGGSLGPIQKLEHVGINWYGVLRNIGLASYYQGLTIHAVLNALIWTTFFILGFFTFIIPRSLNKEMVWPKVNILSFIIDGSRTRHGSYPNFDEPGNRSLYVLSPLASQSIFLYWTGPGGCRLLGRRLWFYCHLYFLAQGA